MVNGLLGLSIMFFGECHSVWEITKKNISISNFEKMFEEYGIQKTVEFEKGRTAKKQHLPAEYRKIDSVLLIETRLFADDGFLPVSDSSSSASLESIAVHFRKWLSVSTSIDKVGIKKGNIWINESTNTPIGFREIDSIIVIYRKVRPVSNELGKCE